MDKKAQEKQLSKLHNQIVGIEQQMKEHATLRKKLEALGDVQTSRSEKTYERVKKQNRQLQEELERRYGNDDSRPNSGGNYRLLQQVMSLRTEEFQKSQAKKAYQIQNLAAERQRIMDARTRLREKQDLMRSLPSPIGKATHKHWGHKYSLYTPLPFSWDRRLYSPIRLTTNWGSELPVWDRSYYTYFPRRKLRAPVDKVRDVLYVPQPLYQSTFW